MIYAAESLTGGPATIYPDTERAFIDVIRERERQERLWGEQNHSILPWLSILIEEVGEAAKAMNEGRGYPGIEEELIQVAAVAVAAVESMRRNP